MRAELMAARRIAERYQSAILPPNLVGIDPRKVDERVRRVLPGYMTMGQNGMGDDMQMPIPPNSVAMRNARGKHDVMTMGGMATSSRFGTA